MIKVRGGGRVVRVHALGKPDADHSQGVPAVGNTTLHSVDDQTDAATVHAQYEAPARAAPTSPAVAGRPWEAGSVIC